jgi:hypothetical protein
MSSKKGTMNITPAFPLFVIKPSQYALHMQINVLHIFMVLILIIWPCQKKNKSSYNMEKSFTILSLITILFLYLNSFTKLIPLF